MDKKISFLNEMNRLLAKNNVTEATSFASEVLKVDPENIDALYVLALRSFELNIPKIAAHYLRKIAEHPDAAPKRIERFCALLNENRDYAELSEVAERTLALHPDLESVAVMATFADTYLGSAFYNVWDWRKSWFHYEKAALRATRSRLSLAGLRNISAGITASANNLEVLRERLSVIDAELAAAHGDIIADGLFRGLALPPEVIGLVEPCQRVGSYEAELSRALTDAIADRSYRHLINIGSSWGYYTVGLARMLPDAMTIAFEMEPATRAMARRTAEINQVGDRVELREACTPENIVQAFSPEHASLVIIDCEGAEMTLLDPEVAPEFLDCDILVECHDFVDAGITPTLSRRFSATHDIRTIDKEPKIPFDFPKTEVLAPVDRWLAVGEQRANDTRWLWMRARNPSRPFHGG